MAFLKLFEKALKPEISAEPIVVPEIGVSDAEYAEMAKKIKWTGFDALSKEQNVASKHAEFMKFLSDSGISHYPMVNVMKYLIKHAPKSQDGRTCKPVWTGMVNTYQQMDWEWFDDWNSGRLRNIGTYAAHYSKPVPYPVLLTISNILEKFHDAQFFVSDYVQPAVSKYDPFLMVAYAGQCTVIERWDEPAFRIE